MERREKELAIGSLLHDIGKILYRADDGRRHSVSGYDFLKEQGIDNLAILNQVRYHHSRELSAASLDRADLAYITYWADNVAAGADRRNNDDSDEKGYDRHMPLASIFNILNGNTQSYSYDMQEIYDDGRANNPKASAAGYSEGEYFRILADLRQCVSAVELTGEYINSLLCVLEATESFVPSSTDKSQLSDISLYDHSKITAAVASCIYAYIKEKGIEDYRRFLFENGNAAYQEKAFLLMSMDISGIQNFIYKVANKNVLKMLRTKSFYLEILLEHVVDELLEECGLSRANLIYSGGGHAYLLLANTKKTLETIRVFKESLNAWFLKRYRTDLYIAFGLAECSANDLMNKPDGSYRELFRRVGESISTEKASRYTAEELIRLNSGTASQYGRECRVCGELDHLVKDPSADPSAEEYLCENCAAFVSMSRDILEKDFVTILSEDAGGACLRLPFGKYMVLETEENVRRRIAEKQTAYVRCYSKNKMFTGYNVATRLWNGDYHQGDDFSDFARAAEGVRRIGVLRADVDNLGQAFVRGFERPDGSQKYVSLSRSATFSRKMSLFFKLHINNILSSRKFSLSPKREDCSGRNVAVIYSGGDDLFLIGAWDEIIGAAVDINESLREFTQGTLTISGGVGIFPEKYPAAALARQTGELEELAKNHEDEAGNKKNSIALFSRESVYNWDDFVNAVVGEKLRMIRRYFDGNEEKGNAAMYRMLRFIRERGDKINLARFAYLLGRMEPDRKAPEEKKQLHREFTEKMYQWIRNEEDCKELITAIYIYVYLNRKSEKEEHHAEADEN